MTVSLREHLAATSEAFTSALDSGSGSPLKAVEALRGTGRSLMPFRPADIADDESALAENELLDPERAPPGPMDQLRQGLSDLLARVRRPGK